MYNKINHKEIISITKDESCYPEYVCNHELELECERCLNRWKIAVPEEYIDYEKESVEWRELYLSLKSKLVELMRYTEMHYSINPCKDKMIDMLEGLSDKFSGDEYV